MLDAASSPMFPMEPEALAHEIEIPLDQWAGNCHGVACAIRDLVPVQGMRIARGHYDGFISRKSVYTGGPMQQHSWLVSPDGRILDPTRWAMECPDAPYIYLGPCDHYDEGGRAMAARMPPSLPGAGPDFSRQINNLAMEDRIQLAKIVGLNDPASSLMSDQIARLARQDPDHVPDVRTAYALLAKAGLKAIVPIDSWMRVMAPETLYCRANANRTFILPPAEEISAQALVAKLLVAFCLIETRDSLEQDLAEHDISLDAYHHALTRFEKWDMPLKYLPLEDQFILGIVMSDILGQGFGQALRVERYAASLGYPGARFPEAINSVAGIFGLCPVW